MIVTISLTPETILNPTGTASGNVAKNAREQLLTVLRRHGFIYLVDETDLEAILAVVNEHLARISPTESVRWRELLSNIEPVFTQVPPESLRIRRDPEALREWAEWIEFLVLAPEVAAEMTKLGLPNLDGSCTIDSMEVVLAGELARHERIRGLDDARAVVVGDEDAPRTREDVWQRWLKPLAIRYGNITIRDRHFGKRCYSQLLTKGFGAEGQEGPLPYEVAWLLGRLANSAHLASETGAVLMIETARDRTGSRDWSELLTHDDRRTQAEQLGIKPREARLTHAQIATALTAAWQYVKQHADALGWGRLEAIEELRLTTFPFPRNMEKHSRFVAFRASPNKLIRFVTFTAGLDRLQDHQLKGRWELMYGAGRQDPGAEENLDEKRAAGSELQTSVATLGSDFSDWM